ncbi:MAG: glycogen synthase GlgA [Clostridiales Family XIII bacterium]|jgi:starch synthase|nr:glycogen synthase GlgA [Clostridiales Family XIII bacterium]
MTDGAGPKVLIVASEAMPFVKTGGLADVVGALPRALKRQGVEAAVMIPNHRRVKELYQDELETVAVSGVRLGWRDKYLGVRTLTRNGVRYYFIDNEDYFGGAVYRGGDDESEQYLFFCAAVLAAVPLLDFKPDVIHCNDWHTGMIPMLLKIREGLGFDCRSVFTIHNIKFQGMMGFEMMRDFLSIPDRYYTPEFLEAHGCANMMKAGLVFADRITTVSPTYAREITEPFFGMGMEGILAARRNDLTGIVNGIDTEEFDPETDPAIARRYGVETMKDKSENKKALRREFGLGVRLYDPIVCMVNRLTAQKGLDLIQYVLEELLREEIGFVMLGDGDGKYVDFFNYIATKYPRNTGVYIGYDEDMAHRIYAGSDFLLMPSMFEPCGLSQMIAQRYGTLPIVRETGGLADTVTPYNRYTKTGDGFSFGAFNAHDMLHVIRLALATYRDKPMLRRLKKNAMLKDNSFFQSAKRYKSLYESMK